MTGWVDLHCHCLHGVDDGAKTLEEAIAMAEALVALGFSVVAPSPHARASYAPREVAEARRAELADALAARDIPLRLEPNAENYLFEDGFLETVATEHGRRVGAGTYALVEAPYHGPVPMLPDLVFRMTRAGVTPLWAHPERCLEFAKKGRAQQVVSIGACLQLDVGSLIGRYGREAQRLARSFLDEGLYAVAATDLHSPIGATAWLTKALKELRSRAGEEALVRLLKENPLRIIQGEPLES